jgi:hypothetical protein
MRAPAQLASRLDLRRLEPIVEPDCDDVVNHSIEADAHSFIVKIWLEEVPRGAGSAQWRGHITHVPSGQRRYVKDLNDVAFFLMAYLEAMDAHVGFLWKLRQWLHRH